MRLQRLVALLLAVWCAQHKIKKKRVYRAFFYGSCKRGLSPLARGHIPIITLHTFVGDGYGCFEILGKQ